MERDIPRLSRREFVKRTTAVSAVVVAASRSLHAQSVASEGRQMGGKGQVYPSQRVSHTDSKSGQRVWRLTDTPNRTAQKLYFTNRCATPDGRWLIYQSDRANMPDHFDLFKMDLTTGESVQLTESGNVYPDTPDIAHSGNDVYYWERDDSLRVVNLDSFEEREIVRFEGHSTHALNLTPDDRFIIVAPAFEERREFGYNISPIARRMSLTIIDTRSGEWRHLIDGNRPLGHVAFSPTDGNLVLYSIHGHWAEVQRPWIIRADGTENHPVFLQRQGEGAGHEIWGASGRTVFATCYGGREPQGMWGSGLDGTNERCVLAGPNIAHITANPEEDRFVADECFLDTSSLWISRKGAPEPEVLCQMAAPWFTTRNGSYEPTGQHPHVRFLPDGSGVVFNSAGDVYLVEM